MTYIEVLVASTAHRGKDPLTYAAEQELAPGAIVTVPLRNTQALGVVLRSVAKPDFDVRPIETHLTLPCLPPESIKLLLWMQSYYPAPLGIITQQFLPKQLPKKEAAPTLLTSVANTLPELTSDQLQVLKAIQPEGTHLLHGETGTGKTRIYIEAAKQALKKRKSVIVLTPEIGLTSQLAHDFTQIFGDHVVVLHSQLTEATRHRLWVQILKSPYPLVIIGPRSALFAPAKHIGLIVVDESHETAYKQDQSPHYHASLVGSRLAQLHHCPIILGSATPLVTDYYLASVRERPIMRMTHTASTTDSTKTEIAVIDLKDRSQFSKKSYLSDLLISAITQAINKGEQTILFLNRRGTARVVFCENCAWQATCPRCDIPCVYHGDTHSIRCHTCDFRTTVPSSCPDCRNPSILFKSIGTKAIVNDAQKLFPEARIQRFDTDNKKSERIEHHIQALKNGEVDIIIGTQTLAKGLDLPRLSVVGIIIADTGLSFPDFSAQERTYQLISQVLGRVGRGHRAGSAIIQTYSPHNPLLRSILDKNWQSFYDREISERRQFLFPPFCYVLKLTCRRASQGSAEHTAEALARKLEASDLRIIVEGPAPAFREKIQNKYQWQITVKAKDRKELVRIIAHLPSGWSYDIDPMNLL